jgi:hypothetical protein
MLSGSIVSSFYPCLWGIDPAVFLLVTSDFLDPSIGILIFQLVLASEFYHLSKFFTLAFA